MSPVLARVARFGVVSVISTIVDVTAFQLLTAGAGFPPVPANILSYGCGIISGFVLNRLFVFRGAGGVAAAQFARWLVTNLASLAISTAVVGLLSLVLPPIVAKLLSLPVTFAWNFGFSQLWVFRKVSTEATPAGDPTISR